VEAPRPTLSLKLSSLDRMPSCLNQHVGLAASCQVDAVEVSAGWVLCWRGGLTLLAVWLPMSLTRILVLMRILCKRERSDIPQTRETDLLENDPPRLNRRNMWFPFSTRQRTGIPTLGICCLCSMNAVVAPQSLPYFDCSDHYIDGPNPDERAVSVQREFGDKPFQIGTNGLMGCTVVVLVSNTHVWMVSANTSQYR
jgi:hypothetical protein